MRGALDKAWTSVLLAPAVLPLLYLDHMMYPMMAPKTFALRALGIVALALFTYLKLSGHPFYYDRLRAWVTWLPGALLAIAYVASLIGVDFYRSFWSTFERGDGLLTLTVCVLYFYFILLSADETFFKRFLKLVAWVGSIAGVYVIVQWMFVSAGIDVSPFIAQTKGRVGGTMGNAAFLAAYLGMALFVTLGVAREYTGNLRIVLYAGAAAELVGILLAATRGTLLALIVVGIGVLIYAALRGPHQKNAQRVLAGAVALVVLFVVFRGPLSRVPFEPIQRLASISLEDGTVGSRLFLWQNLLPEALKTPLTGVGAEHVATLFDRIYEPTKILEEWFDRSHNSYLDYLIQFGIFGLALYLAILAAGLMASWRLAFSAKENESSRRFATLLFLALAVYALQNFFVFDVGVTLWLLLALIALLLAKQEAVAARSLSFFPGAKWVGVVLGVLILLLLVPVVIQPWRANLYAFEAYLYHVVDVPRTNQAMTNGLALKTYADLEFGYNAYFMYTEEQYSMLEGAPLRAAYENAYNVLKQNYERYPYDARTAMYLLNLMGRAPEGVVVDRVFETKTIAAAIELTPKRPIPWYMLANLAIAEATRLPAGPERRAMYETAIKALADYSAIVPNLAEPHYVLADLYLALGDSANAKEEADKGRAVYISDLTTAKRAVIFYEKTLDLPNAKFFLLEILKFEPNNASARADLDMIESNE